MTLLFAWILYGLLQIIAAYQGIALYAGPLIGLGLVLASVLLPFPLIIVIGAFYGAWQVWNWNMFLALFFAMPGLAILIPEVLEELLEKISDLFHPHHHPPKQHHY